MGVNSMKFRTDTSDLGRRLRMCRIKKGLSISRCAEYMEISTRYLSDIEHGEKVPKLDTFVRMLNVLDASADFILQNSLNVGYIEKSSSIEKAIETLTPKQREIVLSVIEIMINKLKDQKEINFKNTI
jgi:transcriptional regulator with XRE-family HTH domain